MSASASSKRHPRKAAVATATRHPVHPPGTRKCAVADIEADADFDAGSNAPLVDEVLDEIDPDLRHRMVSETAYRRHGECGYEDGYDLEDWLQAEADVDHLLHNPRR